LEESILDKICIREIWEFTIEDDSDDNAGRGLEISRYSSKGYEKITEIEGLSRDDMNQTKTAFLQFLKYLKENIPMIPHIPNHIFVKLEDLKFCPRCGKPITRDSFKSTVDHDLDEEYRWVECSDKENCKWSEEG